MIHKNQYQIYSMLLLGQLFVDPPLITSPPAGLLDPGTEDVPYSVTITTTGSGILTFSLISGAFPVGITLDPSTGIISGTTSDPNTYNFTIRVRDTFNQYYDRAYSLVVAAGIPDPLEWSGYWDADPDSHLTLTGANVDVHLDQSGNARNLTYFGSTKSTRDTVNTLDGFNTISIGAFGDYRSGVNLSSFFTASAGTVICVCKITNVAAVRTFLSTRSSDQILLRLIDDSGTKFRFQLRDSGGAQNCEVAASTGVWQVLTARWNGSNIYAQCNHTAGTPVACGNMDNPAHLMQPDGSSGDGSFALGNRALLMTQNSFLSDVQLAAQLVRVKAKYPSCGL